MDDKKLLAEIMNAFLEPMRERRRELDRDTVYDILLDGSKRARETAGETMQLVREAIALDYSKLLQRVHG